MREHNSHILTVIFIGFILNTPAFSVDTQPHAGEPLHSLTAELRARFELGKIAFNQDLSVEGGLGPIRNA